MVTLLLICLNGVVPTDFVPNFGLEDDLMHWRQVHTFSAVGFDGGYYTVAERPARASFSHFYAHGPFFPVLYGALARLFGWNLFTPPLFNLGFLALGLGLFASAVAREPLKLVALALVAATSWPVLYFALSARPESVHHTIAIVLALPVYGLLREDRAPSVRHAAAAVGLIVGASLMRITWGLLLVPVALLALRPRGPLRATLVTLGALAAFSVLATGVVLYLNAPYPQGFLAKGINKLMRADTPLDGMMALAHAVLRNAGDNVAKLHQSHPLIRFQRFQYVALVVLLAGLLIAANQRRGPSSLRPFLLFNLYNLMGILAVNLLLYDTGATRDYRVLAPHLLLSSLLLVLCGHLRLVLLLGVTSLLVLPQFLGYTKKSIRAHFQSNRAAIARFAAAVEGAVSYDRDATSGWCNTLLFNYRRSYKIDLAALPAGIGMSYSLNANRMKRGQFTPRSAYLLLYERDFKVVGSRVTLRRLVETEIGTVYRNLDADCADIPSRREEG